MSFPKGMKKFMKEPLTTIAEKIKDADALFIGAGAGLSAAAGFEYGGATFQKYFSYLTDKYGVNDMYSAGFAPFESEEEFWGYWALAIYLNRYKDGAKPLYKEILNLVKDKDYFVLTTNVDHQFQLSGFDKERLFYTQGDYGLFQSEDPSDQKTYDNEEWVRSVLPHIDPVTHKIPTSMLPRTEDGKKMVMNLRCDESFVEDKGWHQACRRYYSFLDKVRDKKVVYLELGVGMNTPGIIKYPFWKYTYQNFHAFYICINKGEAYCPKEIEKRSLCVDGDLDEIIPKLVDSSNN